MIPANYFLQTIEHLRHYEEVLLFANLLSVTKEQEEAVAAYLAKEYTAESLSYPYAAPPFDEAAALWAAQTFYTASQLLLYRENKEADLQTLLPAYRKNVTPAAILSADLVLRFLPDVLLQLNAIDPDDGLIKVLEAHLKTWHYSGVRYALPVNDLDVSALQSSRCLQQLYVDRIILHKRPSLARHPAFNTSVKASLGIHAPRLWSDFKPERITENETH